MLTLKDMAYNLDNRFKIALDGPAASGKGTIANMMAKEFGLLYVQSSKIYRGLALLCLKENIDIEKFDDEKEQIINLSTQAKKIEEMIENMDLTCDTISQTTSIIATIPEVRHNLSKSLKEIAKNSHRLIMEGRDIGTVIMPDADLKIFISADTVIRAQRRYNQLLDSGKKCTLSDVLEQIKERDLRDTERVEAPLLPAKDAVIIDTSELNPPQVLEKIREYILSK